MYKLLIADDEYWIRENLKNMLDWSKYGIELCEPACDGEEALQKLERLKPHILITDINMPFVSGTELIQKAKELYPDLVAITLSGFSDYEYVRQTLLAGAIDYLLKPLDQDALEDIVKKALATISSRLAREKEQADISRSLTLARSLLRDRAFSGLIANHDLREEAGLLASEMELRFAEYSLVLIRLGKLPRLRMNEELTFNVRAAISLAAERLNHTVFHNIYAPYEFILLSNVQNFAGLCQELFGRLSFVPGQAIGIGVSRRHFSFAQLKAAYDEAAFALLGRKFQNDNTVLHIQDVEKLNIQKRIVPRQENELSAFMKNRNKRELKRLIFDGIGLKNCSDWLFTEVKQTVNRIAWLIEQGLSADKLNAWTLVMDNFVELLNMAVESIDIAEICSVMEQMIEEAVGAKKDISTDTAKNTVKKLLCYIDENYFESMSLCYLSQKFLIEQSYLSRIFKQETGENLMFYINKKRIQKAAEYMLEGKRHLSEISYLVGYYDYAYFNRVFRKVMGKSPSEYIKILCEK